MRGKPREGIRYEHKVHEEFTRRYRDSYIPSIWLEYELPNDVYLHRCQPDGLIINLNTGIITVIEVKLKHTGQAYYQLLNLYLPVLACIFPQKMWKLVPCEVVKWFDPITPFPTQVQLCPNPALATAADRFHVHIWHPSR